jgi:galactose-1-phosphate uridylyltransferase
MATARRFANLFEITSTRSWRMNHGFVPSPEQVARAEDYLADPLGPGHIRSILEFRARAGGPPAPAPDDHAALLAATVDLLSGSHDVIVPRRHVVDGATCSDQLAAAGTLSPVEHADLVGYTVATLADLYRLQPAAAYVAVFQNWLRPAGASLEHLHKQLVAIDAYGPQLEREAELLAGDPQLYQHAVLDLARAEHLAVAANDHAVAVAGVGHRFPSLEIYSTSPRQLPWEQTPAERGGLADLLHALHAATGPTVPTNEEWHYRPPGLQRPMPWRIVLKWRISVQAGFEGVTKIYVNTIDPWTLRDRVVATLDGLRRARLIAPLRIGDEVLDSEVHLPRLQ